MYMCVYKKHVDVNVKFNVHVHVHVDEHVNDVTPPTECWQPRKRSSFRKRLRGPTCNVGGMSACKCDVHFLANSLST